MANTRRTPLCVNPSLLLESTDASPLSRLSAALQTRVQTFEVHLRTTAAGWYRTHQELSVAIQQEAPDLQLKDLLSKDVQEFLRLHLKPIEAARPHQRYLAVQSAWKLDESLFTHHFGSRNYLNLRILKSLRKLSSLVPEFDIAIGALRAKKHLRTHSAVPIQGTKLTPEWQPWEFAKTVEDYSLRLPSTEPRNTTGPLEHEYRQISHGHQRHPSRVRSKSLARATGTIQPALEGVTQRKRKRSESLPRKRSKRSDTAQRPRDSVVDDSFAIASIEIENGGSHCEEDIGSFDSLERSESAGSIEQGRAETDRLSPNFDNSSDHSIMPLDLEPDEDSVSAVHPYILPTAYTAGVSDRNDLRYPLGHTTGALDDELSNTRALGTFQAGPPRPESSKTTWNDRSTQQRTQERHIGLQASMFHLKRCLNDEAVYGLIDSFCPSRRRFNVIHPLAVNTTDPERQMAANRRRLYRQEARELLVPLFWEDEKHWTLGHLELDQNRLYIYDSLQNRERANRSKLALQALTVSMGIPVSDWRVFTADVPQQTNGYDCGIFVFVFALSIMHDLPMPPTISGRLVRSAMGVLLGQEDYAHKAPEHVVHSGPSMNGAPKNCVAPKLWLEPTLSIFAAALEGLSQAQKQAILLEEGKRFQELVRKFSPSDERLDTALTESLAARQEILGDAVDFRPNSTFPMDRVEATLEYLRLLDAQVATQEAESDDEGELEAEYREAKMKLEAVQAKQMAAKSNKSEALVIPVSKKGTSS